MRAGLALQPAGAAPVALRHPMAWLPSLDQPIPLGPYWEEPGAEGGGAGGPGGGADNSRALALRPNVPVGATPVGYRCAGFCILLGRLDCAGLPTGCLAYPSHPTPPSPQACTARRAVRLLSPRARRQMMARLEAASQQRSCAVHAIDLASEPWGCCGQGVQLAVGGRDAMVRAARAHAWSCWFVVCLAVPLGRRSLASLNPRAPCLCKRRCASTACRRMAAAGGQRRGAGRPGEMRTAATATTTMAACSCAEAPEALGSRVALWLRVAVGPE